MVAFLLLPDMDSVLPAVLNDAARLIPEYAGASSGGAITVSAFPVNRPYKCLAMPELPSLVIWLPENTTVS